MILNLKDYNHELHEFKTYVSMRGIKLERPYLATNLYRDTYGEWKSSTSESSLEELQAILKKCSYEVVNFVTTSGSVANTSSRWYLLKNIRVLVEKKMIY